MLYAPRPAREERLALKTRVGLGLLPFCRCSLTMNEDNETRVAANLAKVMAMTCVRNTMLEDIHAGLTSVTRTGDYSDVMVIDADGRKIPWPEVSHFGDDTMQDLMKQVVNRLYTFHLLADDPRFQDAIARWEAVARKWDEPELDADFKKSFSVAR